MVAVEPTRVLHVLNSLAAGGLENGVVNVANTLEAHGFEFHFACLDQAGEFVRRLKKPRVHVLGRRKGFSPRATLRLARLLAQIRPHIIHTHNLGPLLYTVIASGFRRMTILHGEHSELTAADITGKRLLQRRFLYRRVTALHTVSCEQQLKLAALRLAPLEVLAIINGVDGERFQPAPKESSRTRARLPLAGPLLGMAGRFAAHKRHTVFLDALQQLAGHPWQAAIIGGGGALEPMVQHLVAAHPCRERIHLTGLQQDIVPFLQSLDLLVIPSTNEGLSNVLLEAMACGVPVLANRVCGVEEVIRDGRNGWVRDLARADLLAHEIGRLLDDPQQLVRAGQEARRTIVERFSLESMTSAYREVYSNLRAHPQIA